MKVFCSLLLSTLLFSSSVFAQSPSGLKAAIEEFTYAVEVEWDQKNMPFYQRELARFQERIEKLNLDLTQKKELLLSALANLPASRFQQDVSDQILRLDNDSLTEAKMLQILKEISQNGNRGANWNGGLSEASLVVAGVLLVLIVVITAHDHNERGADSEEDFDIRTPPPIMEKVPYEEL